MREVLRQILFHRGYLETYGGEEVSISLVYDLGLRTDQTPPICAFKRNTAGKEQNRVGSQEGKPGEMGA